MILSGPATFARRHAVLLALVLADAAAKVAAFALLPEGRFVDLAPGFRFYLAVNDWGVMGGQAGMGLVAGSPAYTLLLAVGLACLALYFHRLGRSGRPLATRLLLGGLAFGLVAFAARAASLPLEGLAAPPDFVIASIRTSVLLLVLSVYAACRAPRPRAALTLLAAGALGNALSWAYPPFQVVDFLVVPLAPFRAVLSLGGASLDADSVAVVNLADLWLFAFPPALAAWPLLALLARARRTK